MAVRPEIPDNTGYDRVFISPGIDITKVIDEANNRRSSSMATSRSRSTSV